MIVNISQLFIIHYPLSIIPKGKHLPFIFLRIKYKHGNIEFPEARQNCIE